MLGGLHILDRLLEVTLLLRSPLQTSLQEGEPFWRHPFWKTIGVANSEHTDTFQRSETRIINWNRSRLMLHNIWRLKMTSLSRIQKSSGSVHLEGREIVDEKIIVRTDGQGRDQYDWRIKFSTLVKAGRGGAPGEKEPCSRLKLPRPYTPSRQLVNMSDHTSSCLSCWRKNRPTRVIEQSDSCLG